MGRPVDDGGSPGRPRVPAPFGRDPGTPVARIRACIEERAGLELREWVLEARLAERMAALQVAHAEQYADLVTSPAGRRELDLLLESVLVGETRFFRHPSHVKAVTDVVVPGLRAARRGGAVRAWSAGCATGEEAYTLAMVLVRLLPAPTWQVSVTASDLSADALATAQAATYRAGALAHVPEDWQSWGFEPAAGGDWRIAPQVAAAVSFERRNLADGGFPRGFDVIWCRNVLIYFAPEARDQAVARLVDSLNPGGYLFVGYAESLRDFAALEAVSTPDAVLYRKQTRKTPTSMPVARPPLPRPSTPFPPPPTRDLRAEEAVIELHGRYEDDARLARELTDAIAGPYASVVIDLDNADYLDDAAAATLRRARAAARAAGVRFTLVATRPGPMRWLKRCGLEESET